MSRPLTAVLAAFALLLAGAASARAATVSYSDEPDGTGDLVITAEPGEALDFAGSIQKTDSGWIMVMHDTGAGFTPDAFASGSCGPIGIDDYACGLANDTSYGVHIIGGDGDDHVGINDPSYYGCGFSCPAKGPDVPQRVTVEGNGGNDRINTGNGTTGGDEGQGDTTLVGGPGDDQLTAGAGDDTIDGGPGNDVLYGDSGADVLHGGDGDDVLTGDYSGTPPDAGTVSPDVIDGGPGTDTVEDDWYRYVDPADPAPTITEDGVANDGRPGEGDDVTSIEHFKETLPSDATGQMSFTGTDAPSTYELLSAVKLTAGAGDDHIATSDGNDTIDAGAGNDDIQAGFGDDDITPGPGQDTVQADRNGGCIAGPYYGSCTFGGGNDTIHAQDGEVDHIDCGLGDDTAYVDAIDVTTGCEHLIVAGGGQPPAGGGTTPGTGATPGAGTAPGAGTTPGSAPVGTGGGAGAATTRCVVPQLKGRSLAAAKKALTAAHCALGSTTPSKRRRPKRAVVVHQGTKAGTSAAAGTKVAVRLGKAPKRKRRG